MNFTIVGNRGGHAAIHWPGVFLAVLLISAIYAAGVVAFSLAVGWFSFGAFAALPLLLGAVIGINIKRGLQMPPQDLPSMG
jgi:hypothetical protein